MGSSCASGLFGGASHDHAGEAEEGEHWAGAREVQFEAQAVARGFEVEEGFFDLHALGVGVDDLGGIEMRERGGSGEQLRFALGAGLLQALVATHELAEDGFVNAMFLVALDEIEMASN